MKIYELYLKEEFANEVIHELLSEIFEIESRLIVVAEEFTGEEITEGKSVLCILNRVSGEFRTNVVLCLYRDDLQRFSTFQLSKRFAELTDSSCLVFKGTENQYLYAIVDPNTAYDVLVDDGLLEENDHINILRAL
jgi:hypothetical protein